MGQRVSPETTPGRLREYSPAFHGYGHRPLRLLHHGTGEDDAILSSKPKPAANFRRGGGITKYKSQKKEALRKLEATDANLVRLEDIIKEVKRQIARLQRQAGRRAGIRHGLGPQDAGNSPRQRQWDALEEQRGQREGRADSLTARQSGRKWRSRGQEGEVAAQRGLWPKWSSSSMSPRKVVNELRTRISNHRKTRSFSIVSAR